MNKSRDLRTVRALTKDGWTVVRLWEHEVRDNPLTSLATIVRELGRRSKSGKGKLCGHVDDRFSSRCIS